MKVSRKKVDPATAAVWLGYNTHNRTHRAGMVASYAEAMAAGDWHTNVDPIAFAGTLDGKGKDAPVLLNGQHRLHAQVAADVTVEYLVVEGLDPDDQDNMDTGIRRQLGDQLRMRGYSYPVDMAAVLRLAYAYEHDAMRRSISAVSYASLMRFLSDHPDIADSVPIGRHVYETLGGRVSVYGAGHYILSQIEDEQIDDDVADFYEKLRYGEALAPGDPILAYRKQVIASTQRDASRRRMGQANQLALLIKAWNYWRDGTQVSVLSWRGGGKHAEPFPTPE